MRLSIRNVAMFAFVGLAAWLALNMPYSAQAQAPAAQDGGKGKGGRFAQDPRAEARTYHFEDTDEDLPYSVYVSSKVDPNQPAPLVLTLHGLGAPQTIMMGTAAIDLAEEGGYILAAPMGYNVSGWYGSPDFGRGGGNGKGKAAPKGAPAAKGKAATKGKGGGENQPENLRELSEKDAMNVLAMVREEFNVDDDRIYVMGHSMGGAGALHLGSKYAEIFAAVGAEAPAAFWQPRTGTLQGLKDGGIPVMIVHGDIDEVVPVANSHAWVEDMESLGVEYEFVEQEGITHGPVINSGLEPIYDFFSKHQK